MIIDSNKVRKKVRNVLGEGKEMRSIKRRNQKKEKKLKKKVQ